MITDQPNQSSQLDMTILSEWLFERIQPYIKGTLLEMGSHTGMFSSFLVEKGASDLILTDPGKVNRDILRAKFKGIPSVRYVENIDFDRPDFREAYRVILGTIDTIAALNLVENGFFTDLALNNAKLLLRKKGYLIVVAPSKTVFYPGLELNLNELKKYNKQSTFSWLENSDILKATYFHLTELLGHTFITTANAVILLVVRKT